MKVYLISGSRGEYSDRWEWPVELWLDKDKAESRVLELTAEESGDYAKYEAIQCKLNAMSDELTWVQKIAALSAEEQEHYRGYSYDYSGPAHFFISDPLTIRDHPEALNS